MNPLTEREVRETESDSERVSFSCPGCGQDTVIHVGRNVRLGEKRCLSCRGTDRTGRSIPPRVKGARIGTHMGRRKTQEERDIKAAASSRNRFRRGDKTRPSCGSYGCSHKKHTVAKGNRAAW